jgi:diaminopimelate epimerase
VLPDGVENVHFVWTGTEHLVTLVPDVDAVPLEEWGPALRRDEALQPEGANLNVVSVAPGREVAINVRTFEKGVEAETLACGTGVLASAVATAQLHEVDLSVQPLHVETRGGKMTVGRADSPERSGHLYLEGPVASVFRGTFEWGGLESE